MDFSKIRKAIAGGVTGAIAAVGGTASVQVSVPGASPAWEHYVLLGVVGFIGGFITVYFAPANKTAP
jgi:hypothetical protein